MLYFHTIDICEGIDANKTSALKQCIICYYHYFLDKGFTFQSDVWNKCHDLLMMSINLNDITILYIHYVDYCCVVNEINKSEAVNLLWTPIWLENVEHYKTLKFIIR